MKLRYWVLGALAAFLGLWGIGWCLPEASRAALVLPPGSDSPQILEKLKISWLELHRHLGEDILLHPDAYSFGFNRIAVSPAGWTMPPDLLLNSARSFHLRSGHEDESDILFALSKIKPWRLELNPRIYFYGGTYLYPLGAWIGLGSLLTGTRLTSDVGFYLAHPDQVAHLYLFGRLFSVAVYGLGIYLLCFIGLRLLSAEAGLAAAAFYAIAPGIVLQTHYMKPHLLGGLLTLLTFYFCADLLRGTRGSSRWVLAGTMVGLAGGCSMPFWSAATIVALTLILRIRQGNPWVRELRGAVFSGFAAIGAYIIVNPSMIIDFHTFWRGTTAVAAFSQSGSQSLIDFIIVGLPKALTWPIYICILAGVFRKKNLADPVRMLMLGSFLCFTLVTWYYPNMSKLDGIRYFSGTGIGLLLAGIWLAELGPWAKNLFLLPAIYAGLFSVLLDYNLHLDATDHSTRHKAGVWIEGAIPAGRELGLLRLPQPSNSPYFQWNRYRLKFIETRVLETKDVPDSTLPENLILTSPSYDDRPRLWPVLKTHYALIQSFPQVSWGLISLPVADIYGNPLIEIYRKIKKPLRTPAVES